MKKTNQIIVLCELRQKFSSAETFTLGKKKASFAFKLCLKQKETQIEKK